MTKLKKTTKILIVGLGVIGGGYAAALTEAGYNVSAITKEAADLDYALGHGIVKRGAAYPDPELISEAELIISALYPTVFVEWVEEHCHLFREGAVITDVSGVKGAVVERVQSMLRDDLEFVPTHPMAGRESSGVEFSDPSVFRGANYIITPTEKNSREGLKLAAELGRVLGFDKVTELTPAEHDEIIAFISQLTHVIAVSLMASRKTDGLERYTGDSFRDLTRIAKINDRMWAELFNLNREALLSEIDSFAETLSDFRSMLAEGDTDGMRMMMRMATKRRQAFDKPKPKNP